MSRAYLLALGLCTVGCLDAVDPAVGDPLAGLCANQDLEPDEDVSYSRDILPMFTGEIGPGCGCHLPSDPNPIGLEATGLDLSTYSGLRAGGVNSLATIVVPGAPCDSVVWQKVSPGPPFGARMPFNGPPFLGPEERRKIADWIAEGARDN